MMPAGKLHALFASARIGNVPSVVSNVWLGAAMGLMWSGEWAENIPWWAICQLAFAGISLYLSGNFLNDWMDRDWDAKHRPERALPNKLFPPILYLSLALCLSVAGSLVAFSVSLGSGWIAIGIISLILLYTIFHKRSPWAVIPMGLCRGMLPVMGFLAFFPYVDGVWPAGCALFCYVMGLSLSARYEAMSEPPKRVAMMARCLLLATALFAAWGNRGMYLAWLPSVMAAFPYLMWTSFSLRFRRQPVSKLVSSLLAGIPLVDWMLLLPLGVTLARQEIPGALVLAGLCITVPPLAFLLALVLQRFAPAT